jgi:hypothetical protein
VSSSPPAKRKYRNWLINAFILILVTILMLALGETFFRWWDGFQISNLKLEQSTDNSPSD